MFENLGSIADWAVIFILVLLIFGPEKLPQIAQTIGKTVREIKKAISGITEDLKDNLTKTEEPVTKHSLPEPPAEDYSAQHSESAEHSEHSEHSPYPEYTASYGDETYSAYPEDAPPEPHTDVPADAAPHHEPQPPKEEPAAAHDEHHGPTAEVKHPDHTAH